MGQLFILMFLDLLSDSSLPEVLFKGQPSGAKAQ